MRSAFLEIATYRSTVNSAYQNTWADESTATHFVFRGAHGYVQILRRTAYPATFAYVQGDMLFCGYGAAEAVQKVLETPVKQIPEDYFCDNELFYCRINAQDGSLVAQVDAFNAIPIFMGAQEDRCVIASDLGRTYALLNPQNCTPNKDCVIRYLLGQETHEATFVREIQAIYDRKRLYWVGGRLKIDLPPDATMKDFYLHRTGNPREFTPMLEHTLRTYWQRYAGGRGAGAADLSCGLDSSVVCGFFADEGYQPVTVTSLFPGEFGKSQTQKHQDFLQRFDVQPLIRPTTFYLDYPWQEVLDRTVKQPFYHYLAFLYRSDIGDMYSEAASRGATVVFTGVGGDELFEHFDHRYGQSDRYLDLGDFKDIDGFQPLLEYAERHQEEGPRAHRPIPLMSYSAFKISLFDDEHIRSGLWMARPLADPRLYALVQTLPLPYCEDRLLMRIYAHARRLPKSIYAPDVNENFKQAYFERYQRLYPYVVQALQTSVLARNGLIQPEPLLAYCKQIMEQPEMWRMSMLMVHILQAELSLRSFSFEKL